MWNFFLRYTYCEIKFVYVVVPSIVVEIAFSWYLENDLLYWLYSGSINFYKQNKQPVKNGHCSFKYSEYAYASLKKLLRANHSQYKMKVLRKAIARRS